MTVIHPNSISGIASVTSHSNSLYFYESDQSTKLTINAHVAGNVTGDITATNGTFSGDVSIGGTLTYEDVTNIDAVGVITARNGIHVTGTDEELRFYRDAGDRFGGLRYTGNIFKLRLPAADHFAVDDSSNNERFRITSSGIVKVGANTLVTPSTDADNFIIDTGDVDSGISILSATTGRIYFGDAADNDVGSIRYVHTDNSMRFETSTSERLRIDSSGRLNIGSSSAPGTVGGFSHINVHGTGINANGAINTNRNSASPSAGQGIGAIYFANSDGNPGAYIQGQSDGTWGTNDYPGRLVFFTTPDGASSATEKLRITSAGKIGIGVASPTHMLEINNTASTGSQIQLRDTSTGTALGDGVRIEWI